MRYYVRGYVIYEGDDIEFEKYQIEYLADYCSCIKYTNDDLNETETNIKMAG
jgi:hypothetical protein